MCFLDSAVISGLTGQVHEKIVDGTTSWQYTQTPAGAGQERVAAMHKNLSDAEKADIIRRHEAPHVFRCDIQRLRDAGIWEKSTWPVLENLLVPFNLCDMASPKTGV